MPESTAGGSQQPQETTGRSSTRPYLVCDVPNVDSLDEVTPGTSLEVHAVITAAKDTDAIKAFVRDRLLRIATDEAAGVVSPPAPPDTLIAIPCTSVKVRTWGEKPADPTITVN